MKKLTILICVLAILLAFTGVASADSLEKGTFSIKGYTTFYEFETLPTGHILFHLTAAGTVSGYFEGTFTFHEWGIVYIDPTTGKCSGLNSGIMTITAEDGKVGISFAGRTDDCIEVNGHFKVLYGTRNYKGLDGQGTYAGDAGLVFTVEFTGWFYTARR